MTNTQEEQNEVSTLASLFGNAPAPKAEEPNLEAKEQVESKEDTPAAESTNESAEPKQEAEPIVDEDGRIVVSFDDDEDEQTDSKEDITSLKEQVKALLEEKERLSVPQLDPRIAKLNEYVKNGGEINANIWELQTKDYSNINIKDSKDALSVVKDKLKYIEGLEQDEIDFFLKKNYPIASGYEDDFDEEDKLSENMKLRMEAKTALDPLKEFQDKVMLPDVDHNQSAEMERRINLYRAESSARLDEIESFNIELDADIKLKIPFTGAGRNFAKAIITDPNKMGTFFRDRYEGEDGKVDYQRFAEEMYYLENRNRIKDAIYAQGKSVGKKAILEEIQGENIVSKLKTPPTGQTKKTGLAAMTF